MPPPLLAQLRELPSIMRDEKGYFVCAGAFDRCEVAQKEINAALLSKCLERHATGFAELADA